MYLVRTLQRVLLNRAKDEKTKEGEPQKHNSELIMRTWNPFLDRSLLTLGLTQALL